MMIVPRLRPAALLALLLPLGLLAAWAAAPKPCPHGTLDARFCDADGDLIADRPADPKQLADPAELIFAYTPVEDPGVYRKTWQPFLDHLQKVTGRKVTFFPVQSNAAEVEAMRAGRLHVAAFNTGSVPLAVNAAGFVPQFTMAFPDGRYGYEMEIVVRSDSQLRGPKDLRGQDLAFTSPTSNSGYKAPVEILRREFKLEPDRDYHAAFSGKHDNSILGVLNRDYHAAAIANVVWRRMIDRGELEAGALRSIYKSATFPSTAYGVAHDLRPELADKVAEAFRTFDWTGTRMLDEYRHGEGTRFIPVDYAKMWNEVRLIDAAMGVDYATTKPDKR